MSWRVPLLAAALGAALVLQHPPVAAQPAGPDQVSGELMYSISPEEMEVLLDEVGLVVVQKTRPLQWVLLVSGRVTAVLTFVGCKEGRCEGAKVRAAWPLGQRPLALAAVKSYERSVPIAHVDLVRAASGMLLLVGRDIWMLPGRTAANVAAQLAHVEVLAQSMTQHLESSDPGIAEFWKQARP